jgi:hypothetical protein
MAGTVLPYRTSRPDGETLGIASYSLVRLAGGIMADAGLFREKSTVDWLLVFSERKKYC